jgi:hypothetical protein
MTRVRRVEVFAMPMHSGGEPRPIPITLVAAPWEDGQPLADVIGAKALARDVWKGLHICAAPGCNAKLKRGNVSGVCQLHNHAKGVCRCTNCTRLAERAKARAQA